MVTLPPAFLTDLIQKCDDLTFEPRIEEDVPADVMTRLRSVSYFNHGFDLDGVAVEQFDSIPSLQSTYGQFAKATEDMVAFVRDRMA